MIVVFGLLEKSSTVAIALECESADYQQVQT